MASGLHGTTIVGSTTDIDIADGVVTSDGGLTIVATTALDIDAGTTIDVTAGTNFALESGGTFSVDSDGYLSLATTNNSNISISASGALALAAAGAGDNVTVNAGSSGEIQLLSPTTFKGTACDIDVSNGNITASNNLLITGGVDCDMTATAGAMDLTAATEVNVTATSSNIVLTSGDDIQITANGDDVVIQAADDVLISPATGSGVVQFIGGTATVQISDNAITTTTNDDLDLTADTDGSNTVRVVTSDFEQVGASATVQIDDGNIRTNTADDLTIQAGAAGANSVLFSVSDIQQVGSTATTKIDNGIIETTTNDDLTIRANSGSKDVLVSASNWDVDGSGNINNHTGSYKFDSATYYTVVNPCQGMVLEGNDSTITTNWLACKVLLDPDGSMIIPFSVPNGATITRADIKVSVTASSALRVKLMRKGFSYSVNLNADLMDESTGVTGTTTVSLTSISLGTVDTSNFGYFWAIDETAGSGSGADIGWSKIYFTMDTMAKTVSN